MQTFTGFKGSTIGGKGRIRYKLKICTTYIKEGICWREDEFSAIVPIGDRISVLADGYRERRYQTLKPDEQRDS